MKDSKNKKAAVKQYRPLFVLILVAILIAGAIVTGTRQGIEVWMHYFMGVFLCQFAMLKLFSPSGFAEGFQMYDLIAKKIPSYAKIYPYIELILGLFYLSFSFPHFTYNATIIVMGVGAIGVVRALKRGLDVRCACMGTVLDVPLSTVTLTEDVAMGAMAAIMLLLS